MSDRPDLGSYGKNRKRPGPPADDERDPIDPPRATTPAQPAQPSTSTNSGPQLRDVSKGLGLQITLAHHQMIEELAAKRRAPLNKKRYVVEAAIEEMYRREVGGDL